MKRPGLLCAAFVLPAIALAQAPCECKDVPDLINRLAMAHAAIDKYQAEIANASNPGGMGKKTAGGVDPSSGRNYRDLLQTSVNEAMGQLARTGRRGGKADTSGVTCKADVKAESACLEAVLRPHEALHESECTSQKGKRQLGAFDDRLQAMLLTDYAAEEIKGYKIEIEEIVKRLRAMRKECGLSGWVGTIHAFETKQMKSKLTTPPQAQFDSEKVRTMDDWRARRGAIFHDGTTSTAYWHTEQSMAHTETGSLRVGCIGGLMPRSPDRSETTTKVEGTSGTGFSNVAPPVDIDVTVDGFYYELGFELPEVPGQFEGRSAWTRTGGCKNESGEVKIPKDTWHFARSDRLTFKGRVDTKARYIGGSDTFDYNKNAIPIPGIEINTHTVKVDWHFHKID
jgi:hypothetical protein